MSNRSDRPAGKTKNWIDRITTSARTIVAAVPKIGVTPLTLEAQRARGVNAWAKTSVSPGRGPKAGPSLPANFNNKAIETDGDGDRVFRHRVTLVPDRSLKAGPALPPNFGNGIIKANGNGDRIIGETPSTRQHDQSTQPGSPSVAAYFARRLDAWRLASQIRDPSYYASSLLANSVQEDGRTSPLAVARSDGGESPATSTPGPGSGVGSPSVYASSFGALRSGSPIRDPDYYAASLRAKCHIFPNRTDFPESSGTPPAFEQAGTRQGINVLSSQLQSLHKTDDAVRPLSPRILRPVAHRPFSRGSQ
jgi:hypothetical protein